MRLDSPRFPDRRDFFRIATAMSAGGGLASLLSFESTQDRPLRPDPAPADLGNDVPPALACFAPAGGTGAHYASLAGVESTPIAIEAWQGKRPTDEDLAFLPVHRLAALIQGKLVTSLELTDFFLSRLQKHDPKLLFVVNLLADQARAEAKARDAELARGQSRGPLHGIPYGIKDLFAAKGAPTTWGSKPFENRVIDADATVVTKLRDAGAVLIAKLATGALARGDRWFRGRTKNPWNAAQGSSGSSAGPGSATAAGCVPFAIGTETLGSIVSPSRRNGISALRPTFGRVSRAGCMSLSFSMDKVGPMGRNAMDCALVFAAIEGADPGDPTTLDAPFAFDPNIDLSKLRIGYDDRVDQNMLEVFRELGAEPKKIAARPPTGRGRGRGANNMISVLSIESAMAFDDYLDQKLDEQMVVTDRVRGWREARKISAVDYLNLQRKRYQLMQQMDVFMRDWDLYLSSGGDLFLTNLTGHPSAVLPYSFGPSGRDRKGPAQPRCTMIIGKLFGDDVILSAAHRYQTKTDWHTRRPKLG